MSKQFRSFIFPETTKKQIDSMPVEMKLKFYELVTDYGMYGIEPEGLSQIETLIWIPMKDLIDSCSGSHGGAPKGNSNAAKQQKQPREEKTTETTQNNQNNVVFSKTTETTLNNDNHNLNLNDNHNLNHTHNHNPNGEADICVCEGPETAIPEDKNIGNLQKDLYAMIAEHNAQARQERKVPVSGNFWSFVQKESRELLEKTGIEEPADRIRIALMNFLKVAKSDTWQKSFAWRMFCNHYLDYTPEYFVLSRYLNAEPETDDATKKPENVFFFANRENPDFHVQTFERHIADWKAEGRPEGADYFRLQKKWEDEQCS